MKSKLFVLSGILLFPLLASCGNKFPTVTFRQEGKDDFVITIDSNMTEEKYLNSIPLVENTPTYPSGWYEGEWINIPEFASIKQSVVVEAEFSMLKYYAHFKAEQDGIDISKISFNYQDYLNNSHHLNNEPSVPSKQGNWYKGVWPEYTLQPKNITIVANYTKNTFVASFLDENDNKIKDVNYTIDNVETGLRDVPAVPSKTGYDGNWNEYQLKDENIVIKPNYVLHRYYVDFYNDEDKTTLIKSVSYNVETPDFDSLLDVPEVPQIPGYTSSWLKQELTYSDVHIDTYPTYEANDYIVTFPSGNHQVVTYMEEYTLDEDPSVSPEYAQFFEWKTQTGNNVPQRGIWKIANDVTLEPSFIKISFEDEEIPEFLTFNSDISVSSEFDDTKASDGDISLKITMKSYASDIIMSQEFYAAAFSDPNVKSIDFDALSTRNNNDVTYRYWTAEGHNDRKSTTYEYNKTGFGLDTMWKRFSFTREIYNSYKQFDFASFMYTGGSAGDIVWIDNIRANYEDHDYVIGFENGALSLPPSPLTAGNSSFSVLHYNSSDGKEIDIKTNADNDCIKDMSFCDDPRYVLEGNRSLHFRKESGTTTSGSFTTYTSFTIRRALHQLMDDNDLLEFDVFCSDGFYSGDVKDGKNGNVGPLNGNRWTHYSFTTSQITDDDRFFIILGSQSIGDIYFDNIRVTKVD